jgi:hypothetical protein
MHVLERKDQGSALQSPRRRLLPRSGRRQIRGPKTVEAYLRGNSRPRYMERLVEIEAEYQVQCRRLEDAYAALKEDCRGDTRLFAWRWRLQAHTWSFHELNELIREHNQWYPVEANLPMDPRTCDYVPIRGASYRRIELGPDWVLEHFPATDGRAEWDGKAEGPSPPRRAPREPLETSGNSSRSSANTSA